MIRILTAILCLVTFSAMAQHRTDAVILDAAENVKVYSINSYTYQRRVKVSILNDNAANIGHIVIPMNSNRELAKFSATLSDAQGNVVRTVKKRELQKSEYSTEHLAIDSYTLYCDIISTSYPATLEYEYTVRVLSNVLSYPTFAPQRYYNTEVRHASYTLEHPASVAVRSNVENSDVSPNIIADGQHRTITCTMDNLPAVCNCDFAPPLTDRVPTVSFAPEEISYYNTKGRMTSWQELGGWLCSISAGCDILPQVVKDSIAAAVANCTDRRDTISTIYRMMQKQTRYVSIQLGIGGYRPETAGNTWHLGFGDCKGLTYLTKAMLHCAGIESIPAIISSEEHRLYRDFPNFTQANHMLLAVPIKSDTLWLECTNREMDAGEIPPSLCSHEALLLEQNRSRIVRLPYCCTNDTVTTTATVMLSDDGMGKIECNNKDRLALGNGSQHYANRTQSRLFVPLCPFNYGKMTSGNASHCTYPLFLKHDYVRIDTAIIRLPEGYELESIPASIDREFDFGAFHAKYQRDGNGIKAVFTTKFRKGTYPTDRRASMNELLKAIRSAMQARAVATS